MSDLNDRTRIEVGVKPIGPLDAARKARELQDSRVPQHVIETVNTILIDKLSRMTSPATQVTKGCMIRIEQEEIIKKCPRGINVSNGELDFENIFDRAGWKVTYFKAPYNSDESSYFEFVVN